MSIRDHDPISGIDWELLARVLAGEASSDERRLVESRSATDPEFGALVARLRLAWAESSRRRMSPDIDRAVGAIQRRIARRRSLPAQRPRSRIMWRSFAGVAAASIALAGVWVATRGDDAAINFRPATFRAMTEVATPRGQQARIRLGDGTQVILGVASRLRYAKEFGDSVREVTLEGEAYFTVTHDDHTPFRVRTSHAVTEDLGTEFAVRAYAEDADARVVVRAGRVAVNSQVQLGPGDVAIVSPNAPPIIRHYSDASHFLQWTSGRVDFVNAPLSEVLVELRRWYDIDIRLAETAIGARRVTVTIGQAPVDEVLDFVARALDLRVLKTPNARILSSMSRSRRP
jgi:ferric-dicitrate binding protein FerR (iron transport regulator)